jgi:hypothetical protein
VKLFTPGRRISPAASVENHIYCAPPGTEVVITSQEDNGHLSLSVAPSEDPKPSTEEAADRQVHGYTKTRDGARLKSATTPSPVDRVVHRMRGRRREFVGLLSALTMISGCASSGPFRDATPDHMGTTLEPLCRSLYLDTDEQIRRTSLDFSLSDKNRRVFLKRMRKQIEDTPQDKQACWRAALESHISYDLYYAEFDDAGQATDTARRRIPYQQSELHLIESSIRSSVDDPYSPGLNIVVFTHGWHGSARADDDYSIEFKGMLLDVVDREVRYREQLSPSDAATRAPHRVIGIEIAWRGDSLLHPAIPFVRDSANAANVWDRKLAAETVATGAVHELLAFLNQIYIDHPL